MTTPAPPREYVVRKPGGDPDAARRLAAAYDELAAALTDELRVSVGVIDGLGGAWRGQGAAGRHAPAQVLADDGRRVSRALRQSADDLRHYAHRLAKAHEHHGWSLGKLVALGAMVSVGVAAVVVTVGAAAPAEAAAAAAAVEGAEAAAAAAGSASAGVAADLTGWQALMGAIRPLAPFVVPHLVSAGSSAGLDAASQLLTAHHLNGHALAVSTVAGFAGSSAGELLEQRLMAAPVFARRAAESAAWAASGTVASYADTEAVDPVDVLGLGLTGLVARDVRAGVDEARLMWELRVPQLPLGFASKSEWRRFVTTLYAGLDAAGYPESVVTFRGSSITGVNWNDGHPFDSLYRSDWDLGLVHEDALGRARRYGAGFANRHRTFPLKRDVEKAMGLDELTDRLFSLADRPVSWMVYRDLAAVARRDGAYLVVPRP